MFFWCIAKLIKSFLVAPVGVTDQSLLKDIPITAVVSTGDRIFQAVEQSRLQDEEDRDVDGGTVKLPQLEGGKVRLLKIVLHR